MKFFCNITDKPHAIIKEYRDSSGKIVEKKQLCTFVKGECEVTDEEVIELLKARPDMFTWEEEEKEEVLPVDLSYNAVVKKAKELGISVYRKKKLELLKEINEKEVMSYEIS